MENNELLNEETINNLKEEFVKTLTDLFIDLDFKTSDNKLVLIKEDFKLNMPISMPFLIAIKENLDILIEMYIEKNKLDYISFLSKLDEALIKATKNDQEIEDRVLKLIAYFIMLRIAIRNEAHNNGMTVEISREDIEKDINKFVNEYGKGTGKN